MSKERGADRLEEFEVQASSEPSPKKRRMKPWIWVVLVLAVVVIGVGAFEYTSTPGFCRSCHEISVSVVGFEESAHAGEAECLDCHAEEGFVGELESHIGGIQEAVVHFSESPSESDIGGFVPAERCLKCHDDAWDDLPESHPTKDAPCGVCHRDSAHTNPKPIYTPAAEVK